MNLIGEKIVEARKAKGFTQEYLAELAKVNLRTIQRIEKNKTNAREHTLGLICDALQIEKHELQLSKKPIFKSKVGMIIINGFFLALLNLVLMTIVGYLTLIQGATINSKVAGILLSFFIPYFIVTLTPKMSPLERLFKFGTGYIVYIILLLGIHGLKIGLLEGFKSALIPCLIISIAVLYYGKVFLNKR